MTGSNTLIHPSASSTLWKRGHSCGPAASAAALKGGQMAAFNYGARIDPPVTQRASLNARKTATGATSKGSAKRQRAVSLAVSTSFSRKVSIGTGFVGMSGQNIIVKNDARSKFSAIRGIGNIKPNGSYSGSASARPVAQ